jgi:hypothetical protein
MTAVYPLQTSFAGGELSPRLAARVDTDFYQKALEISRNFFALPQGSLFKRPGSEFMWQTHLNGRARLFQFSQSRGEDYVAEFGAGYIRMFNREGIVQAAGAEALVNREFRGGLAGWSLNTNFTREIIEPPETIEITVMEQTITSPQFRITALDQAQTNNFAQLYQLTTVDQSLTQSFRLDVGFDGWPYNEFQVQVKVGDGTDDDAYADVLYTSPGVKEIIFVPTTDTCEITIRFQLANDPSQAPTFAYVQDLRLRPQIDDPLILSTGTPTDTSVPWSEKEIFELDVAMDLGGDDTGPDRLWIFHPNHPPHMLTRVSQNDWKCTDLIVGPDPIIVDRPADWVPGNYPASGDLFSGRLWTTGVPDSRAQLWASKAGNYFVFTAGANPGDALDLQLITQGAIQWVKGQKALLLGTDLAEHRVFSSQSLRTAAVGDVDVDRQSGNGSAPVEPLIIGNEVLYVSPDRTKVLATDYLRDADGWISTDISWAAEHITREGVVAMVWVRDPNNQLLFLMNDGTLRSCIYDKQFQTIGWSRFDTGPDDDTPVITAPTNPEENSYDEYIRQIIQPRLWIQGKDGIFNAGFAGAINPIIHRSGLGLTFPINFVDTSFTGAGGVIDGSGGALQNFVPSDYGLWTEQNLGIVTLTEQPDGSVAVRIEGYEPNTPPQTSGRAEVSLMLARVGFQYSWVANAVDAYDDPAQPSDWIRAHIDSSGGTVHDTGNIVIDPANLPDNNSGTYTYLDVTGPSFNIDLLLADVYQNDVPEAKWGTYLVDIKGHGGATWEWPENTFIGDSDYSFAIVHSYTSTRFGLAANTQQYLYAALGGDVAIVMDAGRVDVVHDGVTHQLGTPTTENIVVTYEKATQELVLYDAGAPIATVGSVLPPSLGGTGENIGNGSETTQNMRPVVNPFKQMFHVDRLLTGAEIQGLYNSIPAEVSSAAGGDHNYVSLCATADLGGSSPWLCVQRGGNHYIETMQAGEINNQYSDSWVSRSTSNRVVGGLSHLEGQTVQVLVNGASEPDKLVSGGQITTEADGEAIVGLQFNAHARTLRREGGNPAGTSQSSLMGFSSVHLRLNDSAVPMVDGQRPADRDPNTPMNQPEPRITGDSVTVDLGADSKGQLDIVQDKPLRTEIVAIFGKLRSSTL